MANLQNLNIGLGVDPGGLITGLRKAEKSLSSFSSGINNALQLPSSLRNIEGGLKNLDDSILAAVPSGRELGKTMEVIEYQAENLNKDLVNLGNFSDAGLGRLNAGLSKVGTSGVPAANRLSSSLGSMQGSVRGSTQAVVNFNRVIQDAPFGIIGVANNIDPMIQSFNQLRAQTGSTTGALKTLLTSAFTGPGALITVFSLASTAALVFGDRLFGAGKQAKEATKDLKEFSDVLADVAETEVGSMFDDLTNPQKLKALKEALDGFKPLDETMDGVAIDWDKIRSRAAEAAENTDDLGKNLANAVSRMDQALGITTVFTEEQMKQIEQSEKINNLVKQELESMFAKARATKLVRERMADLIQQNKENEKIIWREVRAMEQLAVSVPDDVLFMADIEIPDIPLDLPSKMFPPGSLGFMQQSLTNLKTQLRSATDPAVISRLQQKIDDTKESIDNFTGSGKKGLADMSGLANLLGSSLAQAALQGQKLENVFQNIAAQLASRAIITALSFLLPGGAVVGETGFFSRLLSFHSGGVVPGPMGKEQLVLAQGGETIRTPRQERNIGGGGKATINNYLQIDGRTIHLSSKDYQIGSNR